MNREMAQKVFHQLPPFMRNAAATLRGHQLLSWRYGPETKQLVNEALDRDHWSEAHLKAWQEKQLGKLLHRAATQVPYYRDQWTARRRQGDKASWEYLENWPVLSKDAFRDKPHRFVADDCDIGSMFEEHTSGTTGKPLRLWFSRETLRAWFALHEARTRRWNGVSRRDHWAALGGQVVVSAKTQRPPYWVLNRSMNQLYLSANHINSNNIEAYITALRDYHATHLVAYPSSASILAQEAAEQGITAPDLKLVITNAEPLLQWQREAIVRGLSRRVQQTYGMAEAVAGASECEHETLHLWPEAGLVEVFDDANDVATPAGSSGRIICTGLLNMDMPLIRYEVGDRGKLAAVSQGCPCGRTLPVIAGLEGRTNDLLLTRDGRQVYWLNPVLYGLPIREAQIVQESLDRVRVRCAPAPDFNAKAMSLIVERLRARMGEVKVVLEMVDRVPREPNGKFRAIVCDLPPAERQMVKGMSA